MTCLTAIVHWGSGQLDQALASIEESCVIADEANLLARCGMSAPRANQPERWRTWDVQALSPEECRTAAAEARSSARWEASKAWMVIIGGSLASVVLYTVMLIVAAAVLLVPFIGVIYICVPIAEYNWVLGDICAFLGGFSIGGLIYLPALPRIAAFAPRFWTKELLPAIDRNFGYSSHLWVQADQLQAKADAPPAAAEEPA